MAAPANYKQCPRCGAAAPLNAPRCLRAGCGFTFPPPGPPPVPPPAPPAPYPAPAPYPGSYGAGAPYDSQRTLSVLMRLRGIVWAVYILSTLWWGATGAFWGMVTSATMAVAFRGSQPPDSNPGPAWL